MRPHNYITVFAMYMYMLCNNTYCNSYTSCTMSQTQLTSQFRNSTSRKGMKMTPAQLLAKKPRVEVTLKQKSGMIDEAQKRGFKLDHVERTLFRVNQTRNSMLTKKQLTGLLKMPRPSNSNIFLCLVITNALAKM